MLDRRKADRARTFFGGVIAFNQRASTMGCVVRNLSPQGAMVTFDSTASVPDKFDLTIERKQRSFWSRVVWRRIDAAGVAFLTEYAGAEPIPLEWAKRLRDCEAEKATLKRRVEQLSSAE